MVICLLHYSWTGTSGKKEVVWHSGASGKQNRVLARRGLQCQSRRGDFPVTLITLKSKAFGSPFLYPIPCHLVARINKQAKAIRNVCVTPASVRDEWISVEKMSASPYHYTHAQERRKTGGGREGKRDKKENWSKKAWWCILFPDPRMLKCSKAKAAQDSHYTFSSHTSMPIPSFIAWVRLFSGNINYHCSD